MKTFIKIRFTLVLILLFKIGVANVIVYKTFEAYESKNGIEYQGYSYKSSFHAGGNWKTVFKKKGEKKLKLGKDTWGFSFKGELFRIDTKHGYPLRVVTTKKVCYYENGPFHLRQIEEEKEEGHVTIMANTITYKFSETLSSPFESPRKLAKLDKKGNISKDSNPSYKQLFDCIMSMTDLKVESLFINLRQCVNQL